MKLGFEFKISESDQELEGRLGNFEGKRDAVILISSLSPDVILELMETFITVM